MSTPLAKIWSRFPPNLWVMVGVRVECTGEVEEVEFAFEVVDVVNKVTTIAALASYLRISLMMSVTFIALSF
jgi:hypothetical protein